MHELSVALALVELACEEASRRQLGPVEKLHVRIGPLAGIAREALRFSFDVAVQGTPLAGAALEIEDGQDADLLLVALEVTG